MMRPGYTGGALVELVASVDAQLHTQCRATYHIQRTTKHVKKMNFFKSINNYSTVYHPKPAAQATASGYRSDSLTMLFGIPDYVCITPRCVGYLICERVLVKVTLLYATYVSNASGGSLSFFIR